MNTNKPLVVIAGLGDGLGSGLATFFVKKQWRVVGLNRRRIDEQEGIVQYTLDLANEQQVNEIAAAILQEHGVPTIVIHNTQSLLIAPFAETTAAAFEQCWQSMTLSAFLLAQAFLPMMAANNKPSVTGDIQPTFIASGATASLRGGANFSAFSSAKFALRGLVQSLARSYQSQGVHVAHVILDGIIDTKHSRHLHGLDAEQMMNPNDIASCYWNLAHQPRSTWSHEVDLRPASESF